MARGFSKPMAATSVEIVVALATLDNGTLVELGLPRQSFRPQSPLRLSPEVFDVPAPAPPRRPGRLARLAARMHTHRRRVVAVWIVALIAAFGAAGFAGDWSADYSTPGSESRAAAELLQDRFPARTPDTIDV